MRHSYLLFAAVLLVAVPAVAAEPPAPKPADDPQLRLKREHRGFVEAGFIPIAEVIAEGRSVRRLRVIGPRGLYAPSVEIEKRQTGQVVLRVQYPRLFAEAVPVDAQVWSDLAALEDQAFAPQPVMAQPVTPGASPPPICHGWTAVLEADETRVNNWFECTATDASPTRQYALRIVQTAMATRPDCVPKSDNPFLAFDMCFGRRQALEDPELNQEYSTIVKAWYALPSSMLQGKARLAAQAPGVALGNDVWMTARTAVADMQSDNRRRRELLRQLKAMLWKARDASDADRLQIRDTIEQWNEFDLNLAQSALEVFERLTWPKEAPAGSAPLPRPDIPIN